MFGALAAQEASARVGSPSHFDYADVTKMKAPYRTNEDCAVLSLYLAPSLEKSEREQEAPQKAVYNAMNECNTKLVFEDQDKHSLVHSSDKRASTQRSHVHLLGNTTSLACVSKKIRSKTKLPLSHQEIIRQAREKCRVKKSFHDL